MNRIILMALMIILSAQLYGQPEFKIYRNGLIYSRNTMNKLERIVESLNLKYKVCDFNKVFNSKLQTIGHIIKLDTNDIQQAKNDIENKISFENFVLKYPNAKIEKNVLVVKNKYINYEKEEVVELSEIDLNDSYGFELILDNQKDFYNRPLKNSWIFRYNEKSKYSKESIEAFYFPEEFKASPINLKYCRQIGYSECLIDTTTTKMKENLEESWVELPSNWKY